MQSIPQMKLPLNVFREITFFFLFFSFLILPSSPGKKYCFGSSEGQYCHCDFCKCSKGYGSSGYGKCH